MNDNASDAEPPLTPTDHGDRLLWELCTAVDDFHALATKDAKILPHLGFRDPDGRTHGVPAVLDDVRHKLNEIEVAFFNERATRESDAAKAIPHPGVPTATLRGRW